MLTGNQLPPASLLNLLKIELLEPWSHGHGLAIHPVPLSHPLTTLFNKSKFGSDFMKTQANAIGICGDGKRDGRVFNSHTKIIS
jgi:hypothetical protein